MFGWEFPPFNSGGLGTACYGLTKGLAEKGIGITFVLPKAFGKDINSHCSHVNLLISDNIFLDPSQVKFSFIDSPLIAYIDAGSYKERIKKLGIMNMKQGGTTGGDVYGRNLFEEVKRYAEKAGIISKFEDFDLIHAHDWMTYMAGIRAKEVSGKPLVCHIHATEFDRTGGFPNPKIYEIEKEGFKKADKIIAVSNLTKQRLVRNYGIDCDKIEVVHNAVDFNDNKFKKLKDKMNEKVVLFLGRITIQKGPEYFLYSAKRVLEKDPDVKFVVAGSGDMEDFMIEKAKELGISDRVMFTGFLRGKEIDKAYQMADLYVMPSISEPFGITPLESMRNGTPVLISKTSGVSEVIRHALKVDFWDIDQMSNKILAILRYNTLHKELQRNGHKEVHQFSWSNPATKCITVYNQLVRRSFI